MEEVSGYIFALFPHVLLLQSNMAEVLSKYDGQTGRPVSCFVLDQDKSQFTETQILHFCLSPHLCPSSFDVMTTIFTIVSMP